MRKIETIKAKEKTNKIEVNAIVKEMKCSSFVILSIILPIIVGGIIYYLFCPNVVFVKTIDAFIGLDLHITITKSSSWIFSFVRNYVLDMLWAYSLIFMLFYILGKQIKDLPIIFFIALVFSSGVEMFQLIPFFEGTFDCYDILAQILAEIIAIVVIKFNGGLRDEKE